MFLTLLTKYMSFQFDNYKKRHAFILFLMNNKHFNIEISKLIKYGNATGQLDAEAPIDEYGSSHDS